MATITNNGDVNAALAAAKEACRTRNADKRLESDVLNGGSPAQWDPKLEAILACARAVYGLQL